MEEIEALRDVMNMTTTVRPEVSKGEHNQTREHRGKAEIVEGVHDVVNLTTVRPEVSKGE